ncbi:MAG: efflux RND transporter periplasmic adaptor subunit [Odoribacter sp.]
MEKKDKKWRSRWILYALLGSIFLLPLSCRKKQAVLDIPQLVKIAEVVEYRGMSSLTYPGKIRAASNVKLAFRVGGPILKVYVNEGKYVRKGQLLAEIDPRDYRLQYDATEAEYTQVVGESDRVIELYHLGSVSVNEYDKAMAAKKRMIALYDVHRNALNDTRLLAPFNGYIQDKYFDAPEIIGEGTPVLSMINDGCFEVEAAIPTGDFIRRADFTTFNAVADVYPDVVLPLELLDIRQGANYNQLFTARFRLNRDAGVTLAAGMSVSVTIGFQPGLKDLTMVPVSALYEWEGKSYVWLYDEQQQTIHQTLVDVIQMAKDGSVVVESSLRDGQLVVSGGVNDLKEGQKVNPMAFVSNSNVGGLL